MSRERIAVDHRNVGVCIENDWHGNYAVRTFARRTGATITQGPWRSTIEAAIEATGLDVRTETRVTEAMVERAWAKVEDSCVIEVYDGARIAADFTIVDLHAALLTALADADAGVDV